MNSLSLAGTWSFSLDRENHGIARRWFSRELPERIELPGSLAVQGVGDRVGLDTPWTGGIFDKSFFTAPEYAAYREPDNFKVPFWLQPETYYAGVAWYQREIEIPADWAGRRLIIELERPHWITRLWLDGRELGEQDALSTPHRYELGTGVTPGRHRLTLRVDNSRLAVNIGDNSHSISDHTQGNWNGVVGALSLSATDTVWIDRLDVYPDVTDRTVTVRGRLGSAVPAGALAPQPLDGITIELRVGQRPPVSIVSGAGGAFAARYELGADAPLWDEFSPALHTLTATLASGGTREVTFGLREIKTDGRRLLINGRPLFVRATLECAIFPKTGHPPTNVASWRRILSVARAHGLNTLRFHSWCPPKAAFVAADEAGFYFQVEVATWPNWTTTLGDDQPVDAWVEAETGRIRRAYGNHACFVFLAAGNEPEGPRHAAWLSEWVTRRRAEDPRRLYVATAGWPNLPENDFHVDWHPRVQHWGAGLKSRINALPPETLTDYRDYIASFPQPLVSHEIGQWCVYPDLAEIAKYTGHLKPRNFEIFRDRLRASGLEALAPAFLHASGKLQALCYKEDIEASLRTPEMAGFHLLDLHDFPGQGTALVGVLNPFWEEKGYITAAQYHRFCSPTVPLARLARRVFTTDDTLVADLEVAHWGAAQLAACSATWRVLTSADGRVLASGQTPPRIVSIGGPASLGRVEIALAPFAAFAPAQLRLEVSMTGDSGEVFSNDWDLWLYPSALAVSTTPPSGVRVANALDAAALAHLEEGGDLLLTVPGSAVAGGVQLGFSTVFWNTAWTNGQAPHTLGILCDPAHPALHDFPTEAYSNWQWWYPLHRGGAFVLDGLPAGLTPLVRVIDDWFTARSLGLIVEARVGKGRLLLCGTDLTGADDPVNRQLLVSLLRYMADPAFSPAALLAPEQVCGLLKPTTA
jgi:hypothetical protein